MKRLREILGGISDREWTLYAGLGLLAPGAALVYPPAGLIVPGVILTAIALGFSFRRAG